MIAQSLNNKHNRSVQFEERYTAVVGSGTYYLFPFSPKDGKGRTIAKKLFDSFKDTVLERKLAIVGTNGTASITGKYNGFVRGLEELLNKLLQWIVCLLYTNKLPLQLVFGVLDGFLSGPDTFAAPLEKNCMGLCQVGLLLDSNIVSAFFVFTYSSRAGCQRLEYGSSLCL